MTSLITDYEMLELLRHLAQALGIRGKDDAATMDNLRGYVRAQTGITLKKDERHGDVKP